METSVDPERVGGVTVHFKKMSELWINIFRAWSTKHRPPPGINSTTSFTKRCPGWQSILYGGGSRSIVSYFTPRQSSTMPAAELAAVAATMPAAELAVATASEPRQSATAPPAGLAANSSPEVEGGAQDRSEESPADDFLFQFQGYLCYRTDAPGRMKLTIRGSSRINC